MKKRPEYERKLLAGVNNEHQDSKITTTSSTSPTIQISIIKLFFSTNSSPSHHIDATPPGFQRHTTRRHATRRHATRCHATRRHATRCHATHTPGFYQLRTRSFNIFPTSKATPYQPSLPVKQPPTNLPAKLPLTILLH